MRAHVPDLYRLLLLRDEESLLGLYALWLSIQRGGGFPKEEGFIMRWKRIGRRAVRGFSGRERVEEEK